MRAVVEHKARPAPTAAHCLDCGQPQSGRYCPVCGQKAGVPHPSVHELFHDFVENYFHLDSKLFRSFKLLILKPGSLSVEYLEGKRTRYVPPMRLYVVATLVYFFVAAILPSRALPISEFKQYVNKAGDALIFTGQRNSGKDDFLDPVIRFLHEHPDQVHQRTNEGVLHDLPKAMFGLLPIAALLQMVFFRTSRRYFVEHAVFALHTHSFGFVLYTVLMLGSALPVPGIRFLALALPGYLFFALRRFYAETRLRTGIKLFGLSVVYWVIFSMTVSGIVIRTLAHSV